MFQDALLNNATFKDWQDISTPRIQGAMNIHDCLPELDFFVLLSSVVSHLGLVGQTIYGGTGVSFNISISACKRRVGANVDTDNMDRLSTTRSPRNCLQKVNTQSPLVLLSLKTSDTSKIAT